MPGSRFKVATHEMGRERLRHEAAILRKAQHPGVVALSAFTDDSDRTHLALVLIDGSTLADEPPVDAVVALRVFAALARTVADLHSLGVAHERLSADHVLLTLDQRPVLCGFAEATDDAGEGGRGRDCASLIDLGELIAVSVKASHRTSSVGRWPPLGSRPERALRSLAIDLRHRQAQLSDGEIAQRASRVASRHRRPGRPAAEHTIHELPAAEMAARVGRPGPLPIRARKPDVPQATTMASRPRSPRGAAIGIGASLIFAVIVGLARHTGEPSSPLQAGPTTSAAPSTVLTTTSTTPSGPTPLVPARVKTGGSQYEVGQTGDQVAVADWACTGEPTTALLRPSTGEVYVFDALPGRGETVTGRRVATVVDAVTLETDRVNQACPPLTVRDRTGATHEIGTR